MLNSEKLKFSDQLDSWWKILIVLAFVFLVIWILNPLVIIGAGERGVVLNFGAVQDNILQPGIHGRIPIMQSIEKMDVQVQKNQTDAEAASKDLQDTHSTIALNYHLQPDSVNWVYQNIGRDFRERIIDPTVQETVKAVTAKYTAVELITQREKVRSEIRDQLRARLSASKINVDDFSIVNFKFSKGFADAIEQKQTAEQLALKAQRDLDRIKIEAEQTVTTARAEAQALQLQRSVVTPELVELRRIEAQVKFINRWDSHLPQVMGGALPFLNIGEQQQMKK